MGEIAEFEFISFGACFNGDGAASAAGDSSSFPLFAHAGQPTDLHLFANTDHFILGEGNTMVIELVSTWLKKNLPL